MIRKPIVQVLLVAFVLFLFASQLFAQEPVPVEKPQAQPQQAQEKTEIPKQATNGDIVVKMEDFRNDDGQVIVSLYKGPKGFLKKSDKVIVKLTAKIVAGKSSVTFKGIPYGEYAIGVLHDENKDGKMEKNFIGMPKEGTGVSRNAKGFMGPPKYKDSKFELKAEKLSLNIKMKYLL